jgi:1,4-alpha-glucan branching enzyme
MAKPRKVEVKTQKEKAAKKVRKKPIDQKRAGIRKEYLKTRNMCKVTFRLPRIAAPKASNVCVVADFNNWNIYASPMKKLKNGDYTLTVELEPGREYQFRYLIDESKWENDWNADRYVRSPYGSDNSVVIV